MQRKAYRASAVNTVDEAELMKGREGQTLVIGADVGKFEVFAVARWPDGTFERPWRVVNPEQIPVFVRLLQRLASGRKLIVAMEPSGSYGDAMRQALSDAGIAVERVSPKASHDYAEVFDGVPSQHDGKDAAVVAELATLGKSSLWPHRGTDEWEQALAYGVDWMDTQRRIGVMWLGRLEALLARHWPEATQIVGKVSSATLLKSLATYGSPTALAADAGAGEQLARWGRRLLKADKRQRLLASAAGSVGVRMGVVDCERMQQYAAQALQTRREQQLAKSKLRRLAADHPVLQAQGKAVGVVTACVLWAHLGDPRKYDSAPAYRKAMGLNLAERSSGTYQGQLKISKRGFAQVRRWLYLAALRLTRQNGIREWYQAKKNGDRRESTRLLIGITRRLALALHHVSVHAVEFDVRKLFPGAPLKAAAVLNARR